MQKPFKGTPDFRDCRSALSSCRECMHCHRTISSNCRSNPIFKWEAVIDFSLRIGIFRSTSSVGVLSTPARSHCRPLDAPLAHAGVDAAMHGDRPEFSAAVSSHSETSLGEVPTVPVVPEPEAEDHKPFLDGWSPYGPDGSRF